MTPATSETLQCICVKNVVRLFADVHALSRVSVALCAGESLAVMGPNGSGKSTLLSLLSLAIRPNRGEILFNEQDTAGRAGEFRKWIGYLSHKPLLYPDLTADENLRFFSSLHGVTDYSRIDELKQRLDLVDFSGDRPVRVLSLGQLQRVSLARTLLTRAPLLLLDEPATGLDTRAVERIVDEVKRQREAGGICVVVTHEPALAARIATRLLILNRGKSIHDVRCPQNATDIETLLTEASKGPHR